MNDIEKLNLALYSLKQQIDFTPKIAIVSGSGLGKLVNVLDSKIDLPYGSIEGMPKSTVPGHDGAYAFGYAKGVPCVVMRGRVHLYEGYSAQDAVMPIRLMKMMGAEILIITNASGGITFRQPGTVMLIKDQIGSLVASPLRGENFDFLGPRFPDMSHAYDAELSKIAKDVAKEMGIDLKEGVYMQFGGPQYETPAEVQMAKLLGADAVGMSTCNEVIAARHMGMRVLGLSCISNAAAGLSNEELNHEHVKDTMHDIGDKVSDYIGEIVDRIKREYKW